MDDQVTQNQEQTTKTPGAPGDPTRVPQPPQTPKDPKEHHRNAIRTYYSDIAETVQGKGVSMTDIALAEQKRREEHPEKAPPPEPEREKTPGRWKSFSIILAVVLLVGGGGIFIFISFFLSAQEEVVPESFRTTLIPTNSEHLLDVTDLSGDAVRTRIEEDRVVLDGTLNTIVTFIPVDVVGEEQKLLSAREFLSRLETRADTALQRSVLNEFSLGVHLFDKNHGFLIIKTDFFENAFAGMLRWEKYLADDLPFLTQDIVGPLDTPIPDPTPGEGGVVLEPIERYVFQDVVVANRDARALISSVAGNIKMIYSFPDKNTLIITTNPNTLVELFGRLTIVQRQ